jgi:glycosyltransferase involved in cell wall biosynthesis
LDPLEFRPVAAFSKPGFLVEDLAGRGIACEVLEERGLLGWRLVRQTLQLMRRESVDLVHLNSAVPFCKYVGIAARVRHVPVLWHIREDPRGKRVRSLKKWIRLLADRVIVVSSELEEAFRTFPVVRIFNGVDVERFHPNRTGSAFRDRYGIPRDALLFGIVGTVEERKGTLLFLRAAEALLQAGSDAHFAVVGDGPEEAERAVADYLAQRPALASRMVLTGRLDDIPQVMAAIDVLVMPSLWEGFPRSLIEAMACGRAAIASDVGEIPYILEGGASGRLIPRGDLPALIQAMEDLGARKDSLPELGMRARERVMAEFTLERHVKLMQDEYLRWLKP